jgi:hypothetical protein
MAIKSREKVYKKLIENLSSKFTAIVGEVKKIDSNARITTIKELLEYLERNGDKLQKFNNLAIPTSELGMYVANIGNSYMQGSKQPVNYVIDDNKIYIFGFLDSGNNFTDTSVNVYDFKGELDTKFKKIPLPTMKSGTKMYDVYENKIRFVYEKVYGSSSYVEVSFLDLSTNSMTRISTSDSDSNNIFAKSNIYISRIVKIRGNFCVVADINNIAYVWNLKTNTYSKKSNIQGANVELYGESFEIDAMCNVKTNYLALKEKGYGKEKTYIYNFVDDTMMGPMNLSTIANYGFSLFSVGNGTEFFYYKYASSYEKHFAYTYIDENTESGESTIKVGHLYNTNAKIFYSQDDNKIYIFAIVSDSPFSDLATFSKITVFDINTKTTQVVNVGTRLICNSTIAKIKNTNCLVALNLEYINVKKMKELF